MSVEKYISPFVQSHFPEFYKEYGPNFVAFTQAYYEWLESSGNAIYHARNAYDYADIDNTLDTFVKYFKNKYMLSIPESIMADKRTLIKHILDLYKSKGSLRAYELLFRILFNEDIQVYVPGRDLFRLSNNQYIRPVYIEVSYSKYLKDLVGKMIYESSTGASAIVENYITKLIKNQTINVLILSSVSGTFKYKHQIICDDLYVNSDENLISRYQYDHLSLAEKANYDLALTARNGPFILGSLTSVGIVNGGADFSVGEFLKVSDGGYGGIARVTKTGDQNGRVKFTLLDGGSGFSSNAIVTITGGSGVGASFKVGGLTDIEVFSINTDKIEDFKDTVLDVSVDGCNVQISNVHGTFSIGDVVHSVSNTVIRPLDVFYVQDNVLANGENLSNTSLNINNLKVTRVDGSILTVYGSDVSSANLINGVVLISNTTNSVVKVNTVLQSQNAYGNGTVSFYDSYSGDMTIYGVDFGYFIPGTDIVKSDLSANATIDSITRNTNWVGFSAINNKNNNLDQPIGLALTTRNIEVGTITYLKEVNPGQGYSSDPTVDVLEPLIYDLKIPDRTGYKGHNAIVTGKAGVAAGVVLSVDIYDSGYGYTSSSLLALTSTSNAQNQTAVYGTAVIDTQGLGSGYFANRSGFLSDTQHIIDSKYWQTQSYDIIARRMLSSYEKFVRDLVHPAGTALFGTFNISSEIQNEIATPVGFSLSPPA